MKKIICIILCIVLSTSLLSSVALATSEGLHNFKAINEYSKGRFTDVENGTWYEDSVAQSYELGLMNGNSNTTFNPLGNITLAETLTIAARINMIYTTGNDNFSEIEQKMREMKPMIMDWCNNDESSPVYKEFYEAWYSVYVHYLSYHVSPWDYPTYPSFGNDPEDAPYIDSKTPITRRDFAYYLTHSLPENELQQINTVDNGGIPDVTYAESPEVYLLYRAGILTGNDAKGTFAPDSYITRAEVAAIITRMVNPSLRKSVTLTSPQGTSDIISVSDSDITIQEATTITVDINYEFDDYPDGISLNAEYYSGIVDVEWGDWNGWTTTLKIIPLQNGTATIKIYAVENPNEYQDIIVTVVGLEGSTVNDKIPQRMAAIGIDAAYKAAKYPSTLHLNQVTYGDKFENGYGDLITRMVLRCYAANSLGGYGDLYVVILCCEYETEYINDFYWDGLYFSISSYSSNPGIERYVLDNGIAIEAYKTNIANPKEIPFD